MKLFHRFFRRSRAASLLKSGAPRRIRIHSVTPVPAGNAAPQFLRVAFEFLEPPGPWSIQFYEASSAQPEIAATLVPGAKARFYESEDGAQTRVLATEDGKPLWPR